MPAQAENARSLALLGAERGIPVGAVIDDGRNGRECFSVIDDRWTTIEANHGGEGRLQTWVASLAFERLHQCALFTTDIRPGSAMHDHVQGIATAQDIFADVACIVCFLDGSLNLSSRQGQFTAHINKSG